MNVLATVLLLVLIIVAGQLLIPFHLKLEALLEGSSLEGYYRISWAGLRLRQGEIPTEETVVVAPVEMPEKNSEERPRERQEERPEERPEEHEEEFAPPSSRGTGASRFSMPADIKLFIDAMPHIMHAVQGLIRSISLNKFCCHLVMGLADPVDTAVAFGLIWSIVSATGISRSGSISIEPHFGGARLDGSAEADLSVRIISIVAVFVKSLESKPIRKLIWTMMRGKPV